MSNSDPNQGGSALMRALLSFLRHPIGFVFFFCGEFAERCSFYGMRAILGLYMADELGLGEANGTTYMSLFIAAAYLLPLVGGYVADNYFGKYWTIVGFSIPYILGHVVLGIENYWCLVLALSLLAMGSGVIKPNISTLMGLTYDQQRPGDEKLRSDAFAMFYFAINFGSAISTLAVPWVRDRYGYAIAFLIPAALMVVAFAIFALGKPYYAQEVIVRKKKTPDEFYQQFLVLSRVFGLFVLVTFFWAIFDQSASTWVFFANTYMDCHMFGRPIAPDALQALNPVFIMVLLPPITLAFRILEERGTRIRPTDKMIVGFILTAITMAVMAGAAVMAGKSEPCLVVTAKNGQAILPISEDLEVLKGNFKLTDGRLIAPNGSIAAGEAEIVLQDMLVSAQSIQAEGIDIRSSGETIAITNGAFDIRKLVTYLKDGRIQFPGVVQFTIKDGSYPIENGTLVAYDGAARIESSVEGSNVHQADSDQQAKGTVRISEYVPLDKRVSVSWQVWAYLVLTIAEVLISVTGLELAFTAAPAQMKSFVAACWLLTVFFANFFINAPLGQFYGRDRLPPATFFSMLTVLMIVVTAAFFFVARRFNRIVAD